MPNLTSTIYTKLFTGSFFQFRLTSKIFFLIEILAINESKLFNRLEILMFFAMFSRVILGKDSSYFQIPAEKHPNGKQNNPNFKKGI